MVTYIVDVDGCLYTVSTNPQITEETVKRDLQKAWEESGRNHETFEELVRERYYWYDIDVVLEEDVIEVK